MKLICFLAFLHDPFLRYSLKLSKYINLTSIYCCVNMSKLEPIIFDLLKEGNLNFDVLVDVIRKDTLVDESKISTRIKKLISCGKLSLNNGLVSLSSRFNMKFLTDDEKYEYGPFSLARKGKEVFIKSNMDFQLHQDMEGKIRENFPKYKNEIEQLFSKIESFIIKNFNPLDALGYISSLNLTGCPEEYAEHNFEGKQLIVEILHNMVLKYDFSIYPDHSNLDKLTELKVLLDELWDKLLWYPHCVSMSKDELSQIEKNVYFKTLTDFLYIRGDAYPQHYELISKELFSRIDEVLIKKGFSINDYFTTIQEIERQFNFKFNKDRKDCITQSKCYSLLAENGISPIIEDFPKVGLRGNYEIDLNEKINVAILDNLSISFKSNPSWSSPLDKSDIALKPVIKVNNKYYCFLIPNLIRNVVPTVESFLTTPSEKQIYGDTKGNYFESKSLELLKKLLPSSKIYSSLKYLKDREIDGIVIYNDCLLLIEVKGKKRRCIACANDILEITKEDFISHVNSAFEQSKRALDYIASKPEVQFKESKTGYCLNINQSHFKYIFLINVTLESFSEFSTDLNLVKQWDTDLMYPLQIQW